MTPLQLRVKCRNASEIPCENLWADLNEICCIKKIILVTLHSIVIQAPRLLQNFSKIGEKKIMREVYKYVTLHVSVTSRFLKYFLVLAVLAR